MTTTEAQGLPQNTLTAAREEILWALRRWKDKQTPEELLETIFTSPAMADALASPKGQVEAVAIKPLEWASEPPYSVARVMGGHYAIEKWDGQNRFDLIGTFIVRRGAFSTIKDAKAAAQADYEAHIRSALLSPAPSGGWNDMSSAPKDGTLILIRRTTSFSDDTFAVVRWDDDWWQVHDGKNDYPLRGPEPEAWFSLNPVAPSQVEG